MSRPRSERPSAPRVLSHLGVMVVVSAVLGVVVSGLAIPFAGVLGLHLQERRLDHGRAPPGARHRRPAAEDPDRQPARRADRLALRREPRQRLARPDLAHDGQGDRLDRGLPLLRARRPRPQGHAARLHHQPGQLRRRPGRLVDHPAAGQAHAPQPGQDQGGARGGDRRLLRPQAARAALRDRARAAALQGLDPGALPQHRLLRRRRLRRPGRRPALLRRQRQAAQPQAVGAARGPRAEPLRRSTPPTTPTAPSAAATSSSTGWPSSA